MWTPSGLAVMHMADCLELAAQEDLSDRFPTVLRGRLPIGLERGYRAEDLWLSPLSQLAPE